MPLSTLNHHLHSNNVIILSTSRAGRPEGLINHFDARSYNTLLFILLCFPGQDDPEGEGSGQERLSTHERRLLRLQEQIRALEAEAIGEKEWTMRGEASAGGRPLNSALEVDLDFDTTGTSTFKEELFLMCT